MEKKLKHLEMIQGVVNRLAGNSFSLKGWSVTIVAALLALSFSTQDKIAIISISFIPIVLFGILDSYYLWQERLFREVYNNVRIKDEDKIDFLMNPMDYNNGPNRWLPTLFSKTVFIFYFALIITMIGIICYLRCAKF